jgi:hypothetical protein
MSNTSAHRQCLLRQRICRCHTRSQQAVHCRHVACSGIASLALETPRGIQHRSCRLQCGLRSGGGGSSGSNHIL